MSSHPQIAIILVGISIAVLVIAALIISLILRIFIQRWQQQSRDHSLHTRSQLEAIRRNAEDFQDKANHYSPSDPEPYGPIAERLQHKLASIRQAYPALSSRANNLDADTLALPASPVPRFLFGLLRKPRYWRRRVREWAELDLSIQEISTEIDKSASLVDRLQDVRTQVARQIEELRQATDAGLQVARELDACGVHGETLDAAVTTLEQLQTGLSTLPTHSLQDPNLAVEQPEKEEAIAAWRVLKETRRPVGAHVDQLRQWRALRQDIDQDLEQMLQVVRAAAEKLDEVPPSFDSSHLAAELKEIHNRTTALEEASLSLTIQLLPNIAERISHVTEEVRQLIRRIENVKHRFERFLQAIGAASALLTRIQSRMNQTAQIRKHPLVWGQRQAELASLRTIETGISVIPDQWRLDQIDERTTRANGLAQKAHALENQVDDVLNQRDQLMRVLDQPELSLHPGWLNVAQDLHRQITTSQPVRTDWPKNLAASEILNDALRLVQRHKQWVPAHREEPFLASQISHRLVEVQELVSDLATFQRRLQQIANHLRSGELETARQIIERFVGQMKAAKPSFGKKATRHLRSLERLERRGRKLTPQIDASSTRMIREGAKQIDDWILSCHQSLRALPPALQMEVTKVEAELRNEIAELQNWGAFDREPAMKGAQQLLQIQRAKRPPPPPEAGKGRTGQIISLVHQAQEILQERHSLYTAQGNVRSQIRDQVRDRFKDLEKKRQEAQRKTEELKKLKKESESAWPPLICDMGWAEEALARIHCDEQELPGSGRTVSGAIKHLNTLAKSYERVVAEVATAATRLRQERQNLQHLLDQLDRWEGQLKAYRRFNYQNQARAEAIQLRLSEIHRAMREEKRRHKRPMTYSEARQVLQTLWAFAHDRDLPLDGGEVIRIRDIESA